MPFSSLRPRNSDAQRCGQRWSITPTRPELSRNAISRSPRSISRIGAPSRSSSDDMAAGIQYCRIISPMTVPDPTRTRSSLSFCLLISYLVYLVIAGCPRSAGPDPMSTDLRRFVAGRCLWFPGSRAAPAPRNDCGFKSLSRPEGEAEAGARPGRRAVSGHVAGPGEIEMLDGAGDADPHADLRAAGVELVPRQCLQRLGILAGARVENAAVEVFVDDEVTEPAGADDADPRVARIALHRLPDRLAELVAAPRRRLVRREIGIDEHRHHRQRRVIHEPLADKGKGMAFTPSVGQSVRRDRVELAIDEGSGQVQRQAALDRIGARLRFLVVARCRPPRPIGARKAVERHVADRLAAIDHEARQGVVLVDFLVIVADDHKCVELGAAHGIPEMGDPGLSLGVTRREPLRRQFGRNMRLRPMQQLFICRWLPLFVEEVANRITVDEARPVLGRSI